MRVLLVEDSIRLQEALGEGFRRLGVALDVAGDGEAGLSRARREPYDVVILDLMLPALDGLSVLRRLREADSPVHVLVLTARDAVEDRVRGLQMGADDYLTKPFDFEELVARVQALARRKYREKRTRLVLGDVELDLASRSVLCRGRSVPLTNREFALLEYLAHRRGEAASRIEIEDHLYGERNLPMSNAVDSAICTLRAKLADFTDQKLVKTKRGVGYYLDSAR